MKACRFILACLVSASLTMTAFAVPRFQLVDLGTLGGTSSYAVAVSDTGYIVGNSTIVSGQTRAFRWHNDVMQNLGLLPTGDMVPMPESTAADVNDAGNVVGNGSAFFNGTATTNAFWFAANGTQMD